MKINIALVDSGVDINREEFSEAPVNIVSFTENQNIDDNVGHGTAIAFILTKKTSNSIIHSFSLFNGDSLPTCDELIEVLEYIENHCDINIIHLSCGITYINDDEKIHLKEICDRLEKKGILIVAAFDNMGSLSYPAAFDNVIGVYWSEKVRSINEYIYVENSPINILGYSGLQRLPWKKGTYKSVAGSSFIAPYITAKIVNIMEAGETNFNIIKKELKASSSDLIIMERNNIEQFLKTNDPDIRNAIVFPMNKEIKTLLENIDLAKFKVVKVADIPYSSNLGKALDDILFSRNNNYSLLVESFDNLNWFENFDTVILGHTKKISRLMKKDYISIVLKKCIEYRKNVYCFDDIHEYKEEISAICLNGNFVKTISYKGIVLHNNTLGALRKIGIPVMAVVGTSPKQGKFTLQLSIIRKLRQLQYRVGFLGTEPSALLLGADACLPIGYESNVMLSVDEQVLLSNELLNRISNNDLIIVGTQSQIIPLTFGNLGFYPFVQEHLLVAAEPDCVILCINMYDEFSYINRIVMYLESFFFTKVIALVIYPYQKDYGWNLTNGENVVVENDMIKDYAQVCEKKFSIPVYINGDDYHAEKLVDSILNFFGGNDYGQDSIIESQ